MKILLKRKKGVVIRQDPEAGMDFKKDDPLTLVVSNGSGSDIMPDVTNMDRAQAEKILRENGIEWDQIVEDTTGDAPIGYVIEQHPAAGGNPFPGAEAYGLPSRLRRIFKKISMPNIQSMTLPDALNVLKLRDLSLFFIYEKDSDEEENTVISQKPAENTEISTNSSVELTVPASSGRRYKVSAD